MTMRYYSNFIFIVVQLLVVQSDDSNSDYFYQKLLTKKNRPKFRPTSSFSTKERLLALYPHAFYKQFYSKTQASAIYPSHLFNKRSIYDTGVISFDQWHKLDEISKMVEEAIKIGKAYRNYLEETCNYCCGGNIF